MTIWNGVREKCARDQSYQGAYYTLLSSICEVSKRISIHQSIYSHRSVDSQEGIRFDAMCTCHIESASLSLWHRFNMLVLGSISSMNMSVYLITYSICHV